MRADPLGNDEGSSIASTSLAEINVTPMVDVMLVLLVIFMVASSAQNFEVEQQFRRLRQEQLSLDQLQQDQLVEIDLPQTAARAVNMNEEKKLVLSFHAKYRFYIGATKVLQCNKAVDGWPKKLPKGAKGDARFGECIKPLIEKLLANEKLRVDREIYLRADRRLPYGRVLMLMAEIRRAGIHKFGLVAESEEF
jgi:biopolymer transport protein TolR